MAALKCDAPPSLRGTHLGRAVETGEAESKVHREAQSGSLPAAWVRFGLEERIDCEKTSF